MVMKAEQDAALLSQKHPRSELRLGDPTSLSLSLSLSISLSISFLRPHLPSASRACVAGTYVNVLCTAGVMGAHWRMAVSHLSDRHSQLAADKAAAAAARLKQEQTLHELKLEHEKDMGVYAPKAALKAMGADKLRVSRVSSATHAGGRESSSGNAEDSPERYPAVSYFSRLREMSPATGAARPATSHDGHVARGMLYQRNAGPDEDVSRQEDYAGDASPVAWRREESEGRHVESERRRSRIEDAQRRLISPHTPALNSLITACVEITSCLCVSCFCREISSCCSCSCHVSNQSKSLSRIRDSMSASRIPNPSKSLIRPNPLLPTGLLTSGAYSWRIHLRSRIDPDSAPPLISTPLRTAIMPRPL